MEVETVMFIPSTPGGELQKRLKEVDSKFREGTQIKQIKFVERAAGTSVRDLLVTSNSWRDMKFGRESCFICRGEGGGIKDCMKESVLYTIKCNKCKKVDVESEYWG